MRNTKGTHCNVWYTASMDSVFASDSWGETGNSGLYIHSSLSEKTCRRRRGAREGTPNKREKSSEKGYWPPGVAAVAYHLVTIKWRFCCPAPCEKGSASEG
jgi:hypothetical protein